MPGRTPMPVPIREAIRKFHFWLRNSFMVKPKPLPENCITWPEPAARAFLLAAVLRISEMAYRPTRTVRMSKPPRRPEKPKV